MNILLELMKTAAMAVGVIFAIIAIFFIAFHFFNGWWILAALIGQVAILVLVAYLVRWAKYPGLYQAASARTLILQYAGATITFTGGLFVMALIARLHLHRLIRIDNIGHRLGLEFQFKRGSRTQVSSVAPSEFRPSQMVTVKGFEVIARDNHRAIPEPIGTVFYKVVYDDGVILEVAERDLVPLE